MLIRFVRFENPQNVFEKNVPDILRIAYLDSKEAPIFSREHHVPTWLTLGAGEIQFKRGPRYLRNV